MATLVPLGIWIVVPILGVDLEAVSDEELDAVQTIAPASTEGRCWPAVVKGSHRVGCRLVSLVMTRCG